MVNLLFFRNTIYFYGNPTFLLSKFPLKPVCECAWLWLTALEKQGQFDQSIVFKEYLNIVYVFNICFTQLL